MQTESSPRAEAGAMAETVKDETRNVAREPQEQAKNAFQDLQGDLRARANDEATKFAGTLHTTSEQLRTMAEQSDNASFVTAVAREGAQAFDRLGTRIDQGGLDAVMADVRSWARRSPETFLVGAAALGFVAGRIARNFSANGSPNTYASGNGSPNI